MLPPLSGLEGNYRITIIPVAPAVFVLYEEKLTGFVPVSFLYHQIVTAAMYSTLWVCPTAVRLCRSYLALRTGHIFFKMWENLSIKKQEKAE